MKGKGDSSGRLSRRTTSQPTPNGAAGRRALSKGVGLSEGSSANAHQGSRSRSGGGSMSYVICCSNVEIVDCWLDSCLGVRPLSVCGSDNSGVYLAVSGSRSRTCSNFCTAVHPKGKSPGDRAGSSLRRDVFDHARHYCWWILSLYPPGPSVHLYVCRAAHCADDLQPDPHLASNHGQGRQRLVHYEDQRSYCCT